MNNNYQKPFYYFDEAMSVSDYKRNYWLKTLENKLSVCQRHINNPENRKEVENALRVIRNEFEREAIGVAGSQIRFKQFDQLQYGSLTPKLLEDVENHIEFLRRYYVRLYNKASYSKDSVISTMQGGSDAEREAFLQLRRSHYNESLAEFVRNTGEVERIIEYKGNLIQKIDPIYHVPEHYLVQAHFYAPVKSLFGKYYSTYWVNVVVIWVSSLALYAALYFRLLKRLLDFIEDRFSKNKSEDD